jgi:two-component system, NarL family, response regulator LiaR
MTQMKDNTIRVLVVDDHPMVRRGLMALVRTAEGMVFVGEATNGQEAVQLCRELRPTVVLMDLVMPAMDGAEATRLIRQQCPEIQVLVLTSFHEMTLVQQAINAGAVGYLLKTASSDELIAAIRSAHEGQSTLSPEATQALVQAAQQQISASAELSPREREILGLLAQGLTNTEISERLFISVPTVKFHVTNILDKLNASSRTEAVMIAVRRKLVTIGSDKS